MTQQCIVSPPFPAPGPDQTRRVDRLQIVLKLTARCSLACRYCYFFFKGDESWKKASGMVRPETLEVLAERLDEAVAELQPRYVDVIFHGGEPMMVRRSLFIEACEAMIAAVSHRAQLSFRIQTNALHVDDQWLELLSRYDVGVGVSLDGPAEYNDVNRIDPKGRPSHARTVAGIHRLMGAAAQNTIATPATLAVFNPLFDYRRVYDHMRSLSFSTMNFLLPDEHHESGLSDAFIDGIGRAMREVFDSWAAEDDPDAVEVTFISNALAFFQLTTDEPAADKPAELSPLEIIGVSTDGEMNWSDEYTSTDWRLKLNKAHLRDQSIRQFVNHPASLEINAAHATLPAGCRGCALAGWCRGGDVHNRYSKARRFDNPSVYCSALQQFYRHVIAYLIAHGYPVSLIVEHLRQGYAAVVPDRPVPDMHALLPADVEVAA